MFALRFTFDAAPHLVFLVYPLATLVSSHTGLDTVALDQVKLNEFQAHFDAGHALPGWWRRVAPVTATHGDARSPEVQQHAPAVPPPQDPIASPPHAAPGAEARAALPDGAFAIDYSDFAPVSVEPCLSPLSGNSLSISVGDPASLGSLFSGRAPPQRKRLRPQSPAAAVAFDVLFDADAGVSAGCQADLDALLAEADEACGAAAARQPCPSGVAPGGGGGAATAARSVQECADRFAAQRLRRASGADVQEAARAHFRRVFLEAAAWQVQQPSPPAEWPDDAAGGLLPPALASSRDMRSPPRHAAVAVASLMQGSGGPSSHPSGAAANANAAPLPSGGASSGAAAAVDVKLEDAGAGVAPWRRGAGESAKGSLVGQCRPQPGAPCLARLAVHPVMP